MTDTVGSPEPGSGSPDPDSVPGADTPEGSRRRWVLAAGAVAVVVVLAIVAVGFSTHWFGGSSNTSGRLMKSDDRALAAAVSKHVPSDVRVVWSSGQDASGGSPAMRTMLGDGLFTAFMLSWHGHPYLLYVSTSGLPAGQQGPAMSPVDARQHGRLESTTVFGSNGSGTTMLMEVAGPGGAGALPLSHDDLEGIVHDPLVAVQTTPNMFDRSRHLASYRDQMPTIHWPHSPI